MFSLFLAMVHNGMVPLLLSVKSQFYSIDVEIHTEFEAFMKGIPWQWCGVEDSRRLDGLSLFFRL